MKRIMRKRNRLINGLKELIAYVSKDVDEFKMVEIGCYIGESTELFASHHKCKEITAIDPWKNGYDPTDSASEKRNMDIVEKDFDERMAKYDNVIKIKSKGSDAVDDFEDESLDLVYIDGDHRYESVKQDIEDWLPKVKKGGYISGHDFDRVVRAIVETIGQPDETFADSSWIKKVEE